MVKIRELENKQLVQQIDKYNKITKELYKERDRRVQASGSETGLLTPSEEKIKEQLKKGDVSETDLQAAGTQFRIDFDDDEIEKMNNKTAEELKRDKNKENKDEDEGEVRVTELLKLSKDQIQALRDSAQSVARRAARKKTK